MYRYIAVEENANNSDVEMDVFCDPEEANTQAKLIWNGLTPEEKENNHVYTIYVTSEDLSPDAWKEDGRIDWTRWENYRDFEGSFDSARELE